MAERYKAGGLPLPSSRSTKLLTLITSGSRGNFMKPLWDKSKKNLELEYLWKTHVLDHVIDVFSPQA
jgi:hypothetical protein